MQFHWWDYDVPGCVEAGLWLEELRAEGKIDLIGGTNFDTPHTEALVAAGVPLASMQVQYSLLDARPENGLVEACERHGIRLLCYGTVAGGFLSDAWLGKPEPQPPFENRSLTKYKLVIDDFGGWELFQELLRDAPADRRSPRHRHRDRRQPRDARSADGRGGHRRRAQSRAPCRQSRHLGMPAHR